VVLHVTTQRSRGGPELQDERPSASSCPGDVCVTPQLHTRAPSPSLLRAFYDDNFNTLSDSGLGGYQLLMT